MKPTRKERQFAKDLLGMSVEEGFVSEERVGAVLAALRKNPPRNLRVILRLYAAMIERHETESTAVVESTGELSPEALEKIRSTFEVRLGRPLRVEARQNPSLLAGVRVTIGDVVYEMSVMSRLAGLLH